MENLAGPGLGSLMKLVLDAPENPAEQHRVLSLTLGI